MLDERLLEEATRLSGERTYSTAIERALEEFIRRARARQILDLAGSGLREGDLAVLREDRGVDRSNFAFQNRTAMEAARNYPSG